jgi:hypothetical protein
MPKDWPEGWDIADPPPDGVGIQMLHELLRSAPVSAPPAYVSFGNYRMDERGLFWVSDDDEAKPIWLSSTFEVLAHTRDTTGYAWGKLLRWRDLDGRTHEWAMPVKALGGAREEVWRELLDGGLQIPASSPNRNKLAGYLSAVAVKRRARAVSRIGWHSEGNDIVFVLPGATYPAACHEQVLLQTETRVETSFNVAGTIENWRDAVARRCVGNSRLVFAVSAAFASPLLWLATEENGGFHFVGASRAGKTTVLRAAGSVWGGGGINGYLRSWRATSTELRRSPRHIAIRCYVSTKWARSTRARLARSRTWLQMGLERGGRAATARCGGRRNGVCCYCRAAKSLFPIKWPRLGGVRKQAKKCGLSIFHQTLAPGRELSRSCTALRQQGRSRKN